MSLIQFVLPNRGAPAESCGTLVVTWRGEAGLPGAQWQSGAQHGFTSFHRDDLPEREAVPIPQGKKTPSDSEAHPHPGLMWSLVNFGLCLCGEPLKPNMTGHTYLHVSHPAPRCVCHCSDTTSPHNSTDLRSHPPAALLWCVPTTRTLCAACLFFHFVPQPQPSAAIQTAEADVVVKELHCWHHCRPARPRQACSITPWGLGWNDPQVKCHTWECLASPCPSQISLMRRRRRRMSIPQQPSDRLPPSFISWLNRCSSQSWALRVLSEVPVGQLFPYRCITKKREPNAHAFSLIIKLH